ncbi:MAG: hypothetical protein E6K58_04295 [Nitrospirae bacterium]|nr:MAG: hypothetical protein E6K58_04295 [Nitrospirota bacterium]
MNMKKSGITIVLALSLVLPACSSSSRKAAPKAPEPPKVSLIEPSNPGGNMNAVVFEDMTGVVAATFGTASVFRTVEEALAGNTDIIVFLSITSEAASHNSTGATIDVDAKFTDRRETVIDQFQIHTGQRTGPFQQPHQINEGVRAHARAQMQQAILTSPKLSRLAMVRPASSQDIAPQTENGKEKKGKDSNKGKKRGRAKKKMDDLS